jgi:large subunit ribosomal protein L10
LAPARENYLIDALKKIIKIMAITRIKKEAIFAELNSEIASQKAVVLLTTKDSKENLNSVSNTAMRRVLRKSGIKVQVIKNTLINKTFEDTPKLTGPTYVTYLIDGVNSDEVTVPKIVSETLKEYSESISILGSVVNGEFYNKAQTIQLSNVSTKLESLAKIAGALNSITAKIAISVKEIPASVARGVNAYSKTLS